MALQALISLGCRLDADKTRSAINNAAVMGRHQRLSYQSVPIILMLLTTQQRLLYWPKLKSQQGEIIAVASVLEDKDWSEMVSQLKSQIDYWHIAELTGISRAAKGQSLVCYYTILELKLL